MQAGAAAEQQQQQAATGSSSDPAAPSAAAASPLVQLSIAESELAACQQQLLEVSAKLDVSESDREALQEQLGHLGVKVGLCGFCGVCLLHSKHCDRRFERMKVDTGRSLYARVCVCGEWGGV